VAVPLLRDALVWEREGSGPAIAAVAYLGLLVASFNTLRIGGISAAEAGVRSVTWRSLVLGIVAGIFVIAPVWRLPHVSFFNAGWLLVAVIVEEVAFRGVLFALLPLAIGGSAATFTLAHAASGWPALLLVAIAGVYLGILRGIRGDLWACGIAHLLMDLVSLT
jgi:membrane protease YdiL (CAAX protease family)